MYLLSNVNNKKTEWEVKEEEWQKTMFIRFQSRKSERNKAKPKSSVGCFSALLWSLAKCTEPTVYEEVLSCETTFFSALAWIITNFSPSFDRGKQREINMVITESATNKESVKLIFILFSHVGKGYCNLDESSPCRSDQARTAKEQ